MSKFTLVFLEINLLLSLFQLDCSQILLNPGTPGAVVPSFEEVHSMSRGGCDILGGDSGQELECPVGYAVRYRCRALNGGTDRCLNEFTEAELECCPLLWVKPI